MKERDAVIVRIVDMLCKITVIFVRSMYRFIFSISLIFQKPPVDFPRRFGYNRFSLLRVVMGTLAFACQGSGCPF